MTIATPARHDAPHAPSADTDARALDQRALVAIGRQVLTAEADAVHAAAARLDVSFAAAVALLARARGRVLVSGVGKSGHVARKIAATLTSTGTAASFLHPVEGLHGDLGIAGPDDVALLLSKSGETAELLPLLEQLERFGVRTVALVGQLDSTLGRHADVAVDAAVREEACPHDLAPTTSTTVALALGDALAVALLQAKGFRREDFARLHPGGALGRRLLTRVADVMLTRDLPTLGEDATMRAAVVTLARGRGIVAVVDADRRLVGVLTSGDLTRLVERVEAFAEVPVASVMNRTPKTARADEFGSAVVYRMERWGVIAMPVVDDAMRIVGVVHLHDLLRAGAA
ncbi:MAG TPA: KpsF/GutQ family sugar-phosphate isomerase [Gemmatirosa sp.]